MRHFLLASLVAVGLALTGCGSGDASQPSEGEPAVESTSSDSGILDY